MEAQRETIKKWLEEPIADVCYMISLSWWTKWESYVDFKGKGSSEKGEFPGAISNSSLVIKYCPITIV